MAASVSGPHMDHSSTFDPARAKWVSRVWTFTHRSAASGNPAKLKVGLTVIGVYADAELSGNFLQGFRESGGPTASAALAKCHRPRGVFKGGNAHSAPLQRSLQPSPSAPKLTRMRDGLL